MERTHGVETGKCASGPGSVQPWGLFMVALAYSRAYGSRCNACWLPPASGCLIVKPEGFLMQAQSRPRNLSVPTPHPVVNPTMQRACTTNPRKDPGGLGPAVGLNKDQSCRARQRHEKKIVVGPLAASFLCRFGNAAKSCSHGAKCDTDRKRNTFRCVYIPNKVLFLMMEDGTHKGTAPGEHGSFRSGTDVVGCNSSECHGPSAASTPPRPGAGRSLCLPRAPGYPCEG